MSRRARRPRVALAVLMSLMGCALAVAPAQAQQVPAQKNWRVLDSPHFHVIGNAGERDLRRVAEAFEQFREAMTALFPDALRRVDLPTTIVVFRNQRTYTPFKPLYNGRPVEVGGYFQGGPDLNYITLTTENLDQNLAIVYHEFVHLIVNTAHASVPLWVNEGLAEYYSTFSVVDDGRRVSLGRPVASHVHTLRERFMPLPELAATDHGSAHYNEGDKRSIFYAESWALMHYLLLGNEQRHAPHVPALVDRLAAGTPFEQAAQEVLGLDVRTLERAVRQYVQRSTFVTQVATLSERLGRVSELAVTPAAEAEVHATLGALLARMNRPDEARAHLQHALTLDESSAAAHAALALLYLRQQDDAAGLAHLERAAASDDASYLTQFYYAQGLDALRRRLPAEDPAAETHAARMRAALRRAIELRPGFTESYHLLAHLESERPDGVDEALALMSRALQVAPGREDYLLMTAWLHANRQRVAAASAIATQLAARAADVSIQQQAQDMVVRLAAYERQRAMAASVGTTPTDPSAFFTPTTSTADGAARFIPALRDLGQGEHRIHGYLMAIDCARDGSVVLHVDDGTTAHKGRAASFDAVDFISYRTDLTGHIPCGPRERPQAVLMTWRARAEVPEGQLGDVVAVEFLPDGFVPADLKETPP